MILSLLYIYVKFNLHVFTDPNVIINLAKRGLEKERELLMFRSLPGIPNENSQLVESESSDSGSDSNGKYNIQIIILCLYIKNLICFNRNGNGGKLK